MTVQTDTGYSTGTGKEESRREHGNADPPAHVQHYFVFFPHSRGDLFFTRPRSCVIKCIDNGKRLPQRNVSFSVL